ncbi:MAG: SDR family NAD(P)-dependent oxidoreductase [Candidatus Nitrosocosmicus sp.]
MTLQTNLENNEFDINNSKIKNKKVAIVTGSSEGIGKSIALAFAKSGDYKGIVINSRKLANAQQAAEEIKKEASEEQDINIIAIEADVSKEEDCINLVKKTVEHYGRIDVLVNNAGIQKNIPIEETTIEDWYKIIAVDLTGPFVCSREAIKQMEKQQQDIPSGGYSILNISSVHQTIPKPHYIPYSTSKAGIEMMTKTMALELAKKNIRANLVAPGAIDTDMNQALRENKEERQRALKQIPINRIGNPQEVANAVEFLASEKASYITGTTIYVDGGMTLYPAFAGE